MSTAAKAHAQAASLPRTAARWLSRALGFFFFVLGLIGVVLPLLPTTIFWIIAASLFAHASPAMRARIFAWPGVGPVVRDYLEEGRVRRSAKIAAGLGIAAGALVVWALLWSKPVLAGALTVTMAGAALFVATRPEP